MGVWRDFISRDPNKYLLPIVVKFKYQNLIFFYLASKNSKRFKHFGLNTTFFYYFQNKNVSKKPYASIKTRWISLFFRFCFRYSVTQNHTLRLLQSHPLLSILKGVNKPTTFLFVSQEFTPAESADKVKFFTQKYFSLSSTKSWLRSNCTWSGTNQMYKKKKFISF